MKHLYFLLALSLTNFCGRAQDTTDFSHDSAIRTVLVQGIIYPRLVYTANGEDIGNKEILSRLSLYPATADELQQYHNARIGMNVWLGASVAGFGGAIVAKNSNSLGGVCFFSGVIVSALIGEFSCAAGAERHQRQAIRIYNKRFIP